MQTNCLIVGQGISGTWLSYYLEKAGVDFIIVDDNDANSPSKRAAGIINPVTGRRHVEVWLAEEILPFAFEVYQQLGKELKVETISKKTIIDFFPSPQMRLSFTDRVKENAVYVSIDETVKGLDTYFNYEFGYGQISPAYTAHLENILPAWKNHLTAGNKLLEEKFNEALLIISENEISYKNIKAKQIIFCDGNGSAQNRWFKNLPFVPNKGEAITLDIPNLSPDFIYKKGMTLAPLAKQNQWWIGSTYQWEFDNDLPTEDFKTKTIQLLNQWLKLPYKITGHFAAVRPATLQRRPFVGFHPKQKNIGIFNGMGTKGCSLAPYFAKQLVNHLLHNKKIHPEASIERYSRILLKQVP